jgi:hypothetical protein
MGCSYLIVEFIGEWHQLWRLASKVLRGQKARGRTFSLAELSCKEPLLESRPCRRKAA